MSSGACSSRSVPAKRNQSHRWDRVSVPSVAPCASLFCQSINQAPGDSPWIRRVSPHSLDSLHNLPSRREVLRGLAGVGLVLTALRDGNAASAKKGHHRRISISTSRKCHRHRRHRRRPTATVVQRLRLPGCRPTLSGRQHPLLLRHLRPGHLHLCRPQQRRLLFGHRHLRRRSGRPVQPQH